MSERSVSPVEDSPVDQPEQEANTNEQLAGEATESRNEPLPPGQQSGALDESETAGRNDDGARQQGQASNGPTDQHGSFRRRSTHEADEDPLSSSTAFQNGGPSRPERVFSNSSQSRSSTGFGFARALTFIVHQPGERWTLRKAARLIMIRQGIIRAFSQNLKPWQMMCETCKRLRLHQDKFIIPNLPSDRRHQAYMSRPVPDRSRAEINSSSGLGANSFHLGTYLRIRNTSERCPFCKLVMHSVEHLKRSHDEYDRNIRACRDAIDKSTRAVASHEADIQRRVTEIVAACNHHANQPVGEADAETQPGKFVETLDKTAKRIRKIKILIDKCREDIKTNKAKMREYREQQQRYNDQLGNASCWASFKMDGREVERDDSGEVVFSRPRTRRLQLWWDDPSIEPSYIVMVASGPGRGYDLDHRHQWESDNLFLARGMDSAKGNQSLLKSWVALCSDHHGRICNPDRGEDFQRLVSKAFFGVIDVAEMRLAALPPDGRYVALSYTWGREELYTTTLANIQLHQDPGGLETQIHHLPKVVRNAIVLTRALGERYLWVDAICIVQDNGMSWTLNSSVMDIVYGYAYVTICAAEGEGAQTGLMGLDAGRVISQKIEECADGLRLTVSHLSESYIKKTKWNTRGWTFQERLLSRRCIIFAGGRVFFQCRSTALSEDIVGEQESAGWSIDLVQAPLQMLLDVGTRGFSVYAQCVQLYTARDLGLRRDILAAFQGMANLLGREMRAPLHFGLPTSHFDLALLWSPSSACRERVPDGDEDFDGLSFPTWSWCGWSDSPIEYRKDVIEGCLANVNQWLTEHTWIRWYARDGEGDVRPIWTGSAVQPRPGDSNVDVRWMGYGYNSDTRADDYGRILKKEYTECEGRPLERSRFNRTLLEYPFGIHETANVPAPRSYPDQRYLQFWTWTAHLRAIHHIDASATSTTRPGAGLVRCDIEDYAGDWCGTVVLNEAWLDKWQRNHEGEKSVHEIIAISEAKNFSTEESDMWTYYVPRERDQAEWHLYYILLVEKRAGIFYRRGLGKVFKEAFSKSYLPGKKWKEIILG